MKKAIQKKHIAGISILLFIFSLLYGTTYAYGLYFDTHGQQDFEFIRDASTLKISTMVSDLFFPGLDFFRGAYAQGVRTRIVEAFIIKGIYQVYGWEPFPYFFLKVVFIAVTSLIIFVHLLKSTGSRFFAVFGVLFFLSLPSLFSSLLFMYDFGIIAEFFIAAGFLLFLWYELSEERKNIQKYKKYWYIVVLCVITFLGLKTKASTLILPVVIFCYLLLFLRKNIITYVPYFIFAFLFINPVYPLFYDNGNELNAFPMFRIEYVYERLLLNKSWDYNADQSMPAILSLKESIVRMPNTVTAAFGFFFFWFLMASFIFLIYKKRNILKKVITFVYDNARFEELQSREFKFCLFYALWFVVVLFFYQFDVMKNPLYSGTDMRYMTLAIVPLFLFCLTYVSYINSLLEKKDVLFLGRVWNGVKLLKICFVLVIIPTLLVNIVHSTVHLRGGYNAHNYANVELFKTLYRDFTGEELDFYMFSANSSYYQTKDDILISRTFTNYDFFDFAAYKMPLDENVIYMLVENGRKNDAFYAVSLSKEQSFLLLNATLLRIVDTCTVGIYEKLYCQFYETKNGQPFMFYVYKIEQ